MINKICVLSLAYIFAIATLPNSNDGILTKHKSPVMKAYSPESSVLAMDGLQFWFDANALNLNDGDRVSSWVNLATPTLDGVGTIANQNNVTNQPIYIANGSIGNDLPTVKFSSSSFFNFGADNGFYMDDLTIVAVIKAKTAEGHHEFLSRLSGAPYDHNWFFNLEGGFNFGWGSNNGTSVSYAQAKPHLEDETSYVIAGKRTNNIGYSYVNGWLEETFRGGPNQDNNSPFFIGDGNGYESIDGEVGEIIGFNRGVSEGELDKIFTYLQNKWDCTNDVDALLKDISIDGTTIAGFYPKTFNYSLMGMEDLDVSDIICQPFNSSDKVDIHKEGKSFVINVTSSTTFKTHKYIIKVSSMEYKFNEIKDLSLNEVTINDGFWKDLLDQYQDYSINYIFDMYDFTHSFDNFDKVANGERKWKNNTSAHAGEILIPLGNNRLIGDTNGTYGWGKEPWREGLIYECISAVGNFIISYGHKASRQEKIMALKERVDAYIDRIFAAGLNTTGTDYKGKIIDGYFSTINLLTSNSVMDEASGGSIYNHDLYNFGCLIEAGINYYKGTGDTRLLYLATRFAEFVVDYIYGCPGQKGYMVVPPHALGEETLLDLYDLYKSNPGLVKTMEEKYTAVPGLSPKDRYYHLKIRYEKYLDICNAWVTEKGHYENRYGNTNYGVYAQDQCSYLDMAEALGHAVRANLFYSGVSAIGNYTENYSYVSTMKRIWDNIVDTQLYVTGGTGASESLGEAYAGSYILPQDGYCETCASAGMAYFADNMFQIFGDAEYADILELELYNGILGSLSLEGNAFYYCNPLVSNNYERPLWSGATPCCPPMYMKVMSFLPTYIYAKTEDSVFVNQYISSTANFKLNNDDVRVIQFSDLPNGNMAKIRVECNKEFSLKLRMPSWATSAEVKVNGTSVNVAKGEDEFITIKRNWSGSSDVDIVFNKEVMRIYQENISYNANQVALKYGPFVYCAESINENYELLTRKTFILKKDAEIIPYYDDGEFVLKINDEKEKAVGVNYLQCAATITGGKGKGDEQYLTLIPFYIRGNRGNCVMRVWLDEVDTSINFEGNTDSYYFDNDDDLKAFDLYSSSNENPTIVDNHLHFNATGEIKAIYNANKNLENVQVDYEVSATRNERVNSGVYLFANGVSQAADQIDALNVQVEKEPNTNNYTVTIYSFSSTGGYLGQVSNRVNGTGNDSTIDIKVIALDGKIYVYLDGSSFPVIQYNIPNQYRSGGVGIRSQYVETNVKSFMVTY